MYKVIKAFTDRIDGEVYFPGDVFPRNGEATAARIKELSGKDNKLGQPLIEVAEGTQPEEEKPVEKKPAAKKPAAKKTTKKKAE